MKKKTKLNWWWQLMLVLPVVGMILSLALTTDWLPQLRLIWAVTLLVFYGLGYVFVLWFEPAIDWLVNWLGTMALRYQGVSKIRAARLWRKTTRPTIWWLNPTWERREVLIFLWVLLIMLLLFARDRAAHQLVVLWLMWTFGIPFSCGYIGAVLLRNKQF